MRGSAPLRESSAALSSNVFRPPQRCSKNLSTPQTELLELLRVRSDVIAPLTLGIVSAAVELDHETCFRAEEVDDVGTDGFLSAELASRQALDDAVAARAQPRHRLILAKVTGAPERDEVPKRRHT